MSQTLLDQLKTMTVTVADTGDIHSIEKYKPRDTTTNPSLITTAAAMPEYAEVVDGALVWAKEKSGGDDTKVIGLAIDRLAVEFGLRILKIVPGRVSTEVDARLSFDTDATIAKGRILIKIASTWEGIRAAEVLEKEGIHCNLTLLFGLHQAIACADAGATLISPFVGRILDWYKKSTGKESYAKEEDPGVLSVRRIYDYYKKFGYKTEVMGASFRNIGEITELAGCDLLTISPNLLQELQNTTGDLPRKLDPAVAAKSSIERIAMDEATFRRMHEQDKMAKDKLAEGIDGFSKALVALEKALGEKLKTLGSK